MDAALAWDTADLQRNPRRKGRGRMTRDMTVNGVHGGVLYTSEAALRQQKQDDPDDGASRALGQRAVVRSPTTRKRGVALTAARA